MQTTSHLRKEEAEKEAHGTLLSHALVWPVPEPAVHYYSVRRPCTVIEKEAKIHIII